MPTKKLTDLFAERVKPPAKGRVEYFDAAFGGLALRVTETGHKSWSLYYRLQGRQHRFTIGTFPAIKPAQARREASDALERVRRGTDLTDEKRQRLQQQALAAPLDDESFGAALQDYLVRKQSNVGGGTFKECKRVLEREFLPTWRRRSIGSLTRGDVNLIIDKIGNRKAPIQANRSLAHIRAFFNWAVERGRLSKNPVEGMKAPTKERTRDRVLSDDEIRWLWKACEVVDWPFGPIAKLLLLTAQRRDEVASMGRSELDLQKKIWTMPREKAKNNRAHEIQLSTAAMEALSSIPRVGNGLVFTSTGTTPVSGFSRVKIRMDAAMLAAKREELGAEAEEIPDWTLHDLRRTAATGMARLNFPPHIVDKILNHVTGTIRGVAAIYNRFEYLDERRAALEAWGRYVANLVAPAPVNVVELRA